MELSWVNKLRIAAVAALGIVVIGILAWPLAAPEDPLLPVRASHVGIFGTLVLLVLALGIGFAGYFIAWPHGREIGILAVPFGLTVWAARSGPMQALTQAFDETYERQALLHSVRFEPAYWLLIVAAGFAGVLVAQHLCPAGEERLSMGKIKSYLTTSFYINSLIALAAAVLVSQFFIGVFARDLTTSYNGAAAQPEVGQLLFGLIAAFAVAAFVVKKFFNMGYIWSAIASLFVIAFAEKIYYGSATIQEFAETRPATLFPHGVFTALPLQLVALGALGSVLGYWLAVRYDYWRKHEGTP